MNGAQARDEHTRQREHVVGVPTPRKGLNRLFGSAQIFVRERKRRTVIDPTPIGIRLFDSTQLMSKITLSSLDVALHELRTEPIRQAFVLS